MSEWNLSETERAYLRELAKKQAEYAALPVMEERRQMWYDLNDGKPGARPPVIIETWTFDRDFRPPSVFRCSSETGRNLEAQLLRNVRNHELINDDKVIPDTFDVGWFAQVDCMGGLKLTVFRQRIHRGPNWVITRNTPSPTCRTTAIPKAGGAGGGRDAGNGWNRRFF